MVKPPGAAEHELAHFPPRFPRFALARRVRYRSDDVPPNAL
jgi:hypothetical protein